MALITFKKGSAGFNNIVNTPITVGQLIHVVYDKDDDGSVVPVDDRTEEQQASEEELEEEIELMKDLCWKLKVCPKLATTNGQAFQGPLITSK